MTATLIHRGPDGEGFYIDGAMGLGHRRLAIIDLSPAAHQPMVTPDDRYVLSYNGTVYNFQELRAQLEALGYPFRSYSDTEVVLNACAAWGIKALDRFNGMFALAFWDRHTKTLLLARDRYGIKPLYYTRQGNTLLFASEIKALLAHPHYQPAMDKEALVEYCTFQNFFTDKTLFEDVKLLPAGTYLRLSLAESRPFNPQRYWDYHFTEPEAPKAAPAYVEELDRLLRQAVSRQLVSDVEIGAYLSGGLDSGSITALAAGQLPYIKTFTVGFDLHSVSGMEMGSDEREQAEHLSYLYQTEHYEVVLKAGDMERILPRLTWHLEEPRVGQSYPNFYAAQLTSKFVRVVLAGTGGDELFGGYPWRYYRAFEARDFEHYLDGYYQYWQRLIPDTLTAQVFRPIWSEVKQVSPRAIFRAVFPQNTVPLTRLTDYINHALYFEAKTFLHGLLVVEDKLSMGHGLETRVPFLDNDLVDFAMTVPVHLKLANLGQIIPMNENEPGKKPRYFQQTRDGKLLLRQAMAHHIPAEITDRAKQGFSAPDASWFKGDSIDYVRHRLFNERALLYQFLDYKTVQKLVNDHLEGCHNRRLLIWSLLNLVQWCETFL